MLTLTAILGIGFLIFVHELGHYLACRLTKTRTETFSVGFGPRLFGWESRPGEKRRLTWGQRQLDATEHAMDFRISAIPLGGYVKMAGENPGEKSGSADEFASKPTWARVFIISAGVMMNAIAAFALYLAAYAGGLVSEPAIVGGVRPGGGAWVAGLEPGDRIVAIDGTKVRTFTDLRMESALLAGDEDATFRYERAGKTVETAVRPRFDEELGALQIGIVAPWRLEIRVDGKTLVVEPDDEVVVAGVAARGGSETYDVLVTALQAGVDPVRIVKARTGGHGEAGEPEVLEVAVASRAPDTEAAAKAPWKIGVEPWGRPKVRALRGAAAEKLQPGDEILSATVADGRVVEIDSRFVWNTIRFAPALASLDVQRAKARVAVPIGLEGPEAISRFLADVHAEFETTTRVKPVDGSRPVNLLETEQIARYERVPAAAAGLQPGDLVFKMKETQIQKYEDILKVLRTVSSADPIPVWVRRPDGEEKQLTVVPARPVPYAGISFEQTVLSEVVVPEGFLAAIPAALRRTGREIQNVFRTIGSFFAGTISFNKNIGGPVQLVSLSGSAAGQSWQLFFVFLAYVSVTLAVLNILPIPVLDGGHLLFIALEKIKGAPLKESTIAKFQMVGMVLILVLLGFALKNDIKFLMD